MENEKTQKEQVENINNVIKEEFSVDNRKEEKVEDKKEEKQEKEPEKNIKEEKEEKKEEEKKDEKPEQTEQKEKPILVSVEEYDFIPQKFRIIIDDKLDLNKTIAKIAKSYVHLESYASRKNSENERLKKILNEIKDKRENNEDELSEKEMEELIDDPKNFLKKYKEKILKQKEMFKEEPQNNENSELIDKINLWLINNDVDDKTKEEMGQIYSSMNEQDKIKWSSLPIEDLLEHLKLKVENKRLKTGERYIPKKPAIDDAKNVAPTPKSKVNLNGMAYFIGKEFGLSEDEIKKTINE